MKDIEEYNLELGKEGMDLMMKYDLNTRFNLTIPKTLKRQLEEIAENENRTLTNCIINILKEKVKTAN